MFNKLTNYFNAASNNIKVASAKMERHSQEMLEKAEDSFFDEFGVSTEEHKAAQVAAKALPKLKAKAEKKALATMKAAEANSGKHYSYNEGVFDFNKIV